MYSKYAFLIELDVKDNMNGLRGYYEEKIGFKTLTTFPPLSPIRNFMRCAFFWSLMAYRVNDSVEQIVDSNPDDETHIKFMVCLYFTIFAIYFY